MKKLLSCFNKVISFKNQIKFVPVHFGAPKMTSLEYLKVSAKVMQENFFCLSRGMGHNLDQHDFVNSYQNVESFESLNIWTISEWLIVIFKIRMSFQCLFDKIWARMDSSHPEAVSRHPKAQKWLPSNFFDLWLSIDTKNSTLWAIVLAKLAVERPWWKMKIFMQKYVKIKIFLIHESYIHQKKA